MIRNKGGAWCEEQTTMNRMYTKISVKSEGECLRFSPQDTMREEFAELEKYDFMVVCNALVTELKELQSENDD